MPSNDRLKCSFCGKTQDQVKKLIAGPEVYICDECVELCNEILDEEFFEGKDKEGFEATNVTMEAALDAIRDALIEDLNKKKFKDVEAVYQLDCTAGKASKVESPIKGMFYIEVTKRVVKELKPKTSFADKLVAFANKPIVKTVAKG